MNGRVHSLAKRVAPRTVDAPGCLPQTTIEEMGARLFRPPGNRGPSCIQWAACSPDLMNGRVRHQMKRGIHRVESFCFHVNERRPFARPQTQSGCLPQKPRSKRWVSHLFRPPKNGSRVVFSGQPERADCRGFCGKEMIGHDTWLVKRGWTRGDGGTSEFLSFLE